MIEAVFGSHFLTYVGGIVVGVCMVLAIQWTRRQKHIAQVTLIMTRINPMQCKLRVRSEVRTKQIDAENTLLELAIALRETADEWEEAHSRAAARRGE